MPYTYQAFGLSVHSEIRLPELPEADGAADVVIRRGKNPWTPPEGFKSQFATPDEIYFHWEPAGVVGVRAGRDVVADLVPDLEESASSVVLLGPVLAAVLHQRAMLVLHASAVEVDGRAVLFLGDKGFGKSTMAVAMKERGYQLVADDVVAIAFDPERGPCVVPSFPQAKLWPSAAAAIGLDAESLPRLQRGYEKRAYRVRDGFPTKPVPLGRAYVLSIGDTLGVEPLSSLDGVVAIVRAAYLLEHLRATQTDGRNLRQSAIAAAVARPARLSRPDSLDLLSDVADLVVSDVERSAPAMMRRRHA